VRCCTAGTKRGAVSADPRLGQRMGGGPAGAGPEPLAHRLAEMPDWVYRDKPQPVSNACWWQWVNWWGSSAEVRGGWRGFGRTPATRSSAPQPMGCKQDPVWGADPKPASDFLLGLRNWEAHPALRLTGPSGTQQSAGQWPDSSRHEAGGAQDQNPCRLSPPGDAAAGCPPEGHL